jgi:hypothetical protein
MKRRLSSAILIGWLCQIGLSVLLPEIALVGGRVLSMTIGTDYGWADHTHDSKRQMRSFDGSSCRLLRAPWARGRWAVR